MAEPEHLTPHERQLRDAAAREWLTAPESDGLDPCCARELSDRARHDKLLRKLRAADPARKLQALRAAGAGTAPGMATTEDPGRADDGQGCNHEQCCGVHGQGGAGEGVGDGEGEGEGGPADEGAGAGGAPTVFITIFFPFRKFVILLFIYFFYRKFNNNI